jgi:spore coat protein U-like protein
MNKMYKRRKKIMTCIASFMLVVATISIQSVKASALNNASQTVTVSTTVDPTVTMAVSTNSISFGTITPLTTQYDLPSAISVTIQSNSQFKITALATDDFKSGGTTPNIMTIDHLKVKASTSSTWLNMSKTTPVIVLDNQPATASKVYPVDFRVVTDWTNAKPDTYSTSLSFNASQF